jgi:hypothetical protein
MTAQAMYVGPLCVCWLIIVCYVKLHVSTQSWLSAAMLAAAAAAAGSSHCTLQEAPAATGTSVAPVPAAAYHDIASPASWKQ